MHKVVLPDKNSVALITQFIVLLPWKTQMTHEFSITSADSVREGDETNMQKSWDSCSNVRGSFRGTLK